MQWEYDMDTEVSAGPFPRRGGLHGVCMCPRGKLCVYARRRHRLQHHVTQCSVVQSISCIVTSGRNVN